jgi:hypothetical protein
MKRSLMLVATISGLSLVSCTTSEDEPPAASTPSTGAVPTPSASPAPPPPKPARPSDATLTGEFDVTATLVSTSVNFRGPRTSRYPLLFDPKCSQGPCDVLITAPGREGWDSRGLFLRQRGRYRWLRRYSPFTCDDEEIPANAEYLIRPMKVRLDEDGQTWIVSKFEGSLNERALKLGGCFPLGESRWVLRGRLAE